MSDYFLVPAHSIADQFWCEMKVDLEKKYGDIVKPEKEKGKEIHENLLLEISDIQKVRVKTPADHLDVITENIFNQIVQCFNIGITRELQIFFNYGTIFVSGKLDEVNIIMEEGRDSINRRRKFKKTKLIETKTRTSNKRPTPSQIYRDKIQCLIYWYGLNYLINKNLNVEELCLAFGIDTKNVLLSEEYMKSFSKSDQLLLFKTKHKSDYYMQGINSAFREFGKLPKLSEGIILRYIFQETGEEIFKQEFTFDLDYFENKIKWAMDYWLGKRNPIPENEKYRWKCNYCDYKNFGCPIYVTEHPPDAPHIPVRSS